MSWLGGAEIRSCRNHKCKHKGVPFNTSGFPKPVCLECGSKLKMARNLGNYTGEVRVYAPSGEMSPIIRTDTNQPLTPQPFTDQQVQAANEARQQHIIAFDDKTHKWVCKCEGVFDSAQEKELHLDMVIPGRRNHFTYRTHNSGMWECWCGFQTELADQAQKHDTPRSHSQPGIICGATRQVQSREGNSTWSVQPNIIQGCPIAPTPKIYMSITMFAYWKWLAMKFNTEWLAYLKGKYVAEGDMVGWHIEDMYFPRQKVNGAHVDVVNEREDLLPGTIGDVHSHVRMDAFFSEEDKRHFNHDVHLVINADGKIDSSVRIQLNCGGQSRAKAGLVFMAGDELEGIMEELESKIVTQGSGGKYGGK